MRQKNIPKGPKEKSTKPGHHMYVDLTSSKYTLAGGSKYWCLAVDDNDTTTTDLDEETSTKKSDTDEEIEAITPSSSTIIGPPIQ